MKPWKTSSNWNFSNGSIWMLRLMTWYREQQVETWANKTYKRLMLGHEGIRFRIWSICFTVRYKMQPQSCVKLELNKVWDYIICPNAYKQLPKFIIKTTWVMKTKNIMASWVFSSVTDWSMPYQIWTCQNNSKTCRHLPNVNRLQVWDQT